MKNISISYHLIFYFLKSHFLLTYSIITIPAIIFILSLSCTNENLAKRYSVQKRSAEANGNIGTFTSRELGSYADRLITLEIGQWTGPIKTDNQFAFFKCVNKLPTREQTYEETRQLIQNSLRPYWQNKDKQRVLQEIRSHINLVTYPEKLKLIHLN